MRIDELSVMMNSPLIVVIMIMKTKNIIKSFLLKRIINNFAGKLIINA
jgi:hypothetical protein